MATKPHIQQSNDWPEEPKNETTNAFLVVFVAAGLGGPILIVLVYVILELFR
ncbi:MAG: hypothetical protein AAF750_12365 [Planctomycetota bacterium]